MTAPKYYDCFGLLMTAQEIGESYNLSADVVRWRLGHGWDMEKTVSTPVIVKPRRKTKYPCGVQHPLECLECKYSRCISENYPAMRGEWYKETKVWQK